MTQTPFEPPLTLPELPPNMEWVIHAVADRFTINLSYKVPKDADEEDGDAGEDVKGDPRANGYVSSHTHRHSPVMLQEEWEREVVEAAKTLWNHYVEGNRHAQWADEIMRRTR